MSPASYLFKSPAQFLKWTTYVQDRASVLCERLMILICCYESWGYAVWTVLKALSVNSTISSTSAPCNRHNISVFAFARSLLSIIWYRDDESTELASSSISWGLDDGMSWLVRTMGPSFCYDRLSVVEYRRYPAAPIWCIQQRLGWTDDGVESQAMMNMIGFVVRFRHIMFIASICLLKFWADTGVCSVLVCVQLHGLCTRGYLIIFSTIEYLHEWISPRQHPRLE